MLIWPWIAAPLKSSYASIEAGSTHRGAAVDQELD
jgi:hypothetical protein